MAERNERSLAPLGQGWPFGELENWGPFGRGASRGLLADLFGAPAAGVARDRVFAPAVDVSESDEAYVITAELPGAGKDDVTVELHDGVLTIRGEKKSEREETRDEARYVERTYGSFSRAFTLPSNADGNHLEAGFENGVLTVKVPKMEEAKPRVISIKS